VLRVQHHGELIWGGFALGSGFDVSLEYDKGVRVPGGVIGLNDDYDLNSLLARFLALNQCLIPASLRALEDALRNYRATYREEAAMKAWTLSYRFLTAVYNNPEGMPDLAAAAAKHEQNELVQEFLLSAECKEVLKSAQERLTHVSTSEVATWWYIFWVRDLTYVQGGS
jgi:hypothetical protein